MGLGGVLCAGSGFDRWTTELTVVQAKFELLLIRYVIVVYFLGYDHFVVVGVGVGF
jgi:hypothetical protein